MCSDFSIRSYVVWLILLTKVWLGKVEAGVFVKPRGAGDEWNNPLYSQDAPVIPFIPSSWGGVNQTSLQYGCNVTNGRLICFSGSRVLAAHESVTYLFDMTVTPSKPLNLTSHYGQRYLQVG